MNNKSIQTAITILTEETKKWKMPIVGKIENQFKDPYKVLISCLLSLRTKDKVTEGASYRLFSIANTPQSISALSIKRIEKAIYPVGFYRRKAMTIKHVSTLLIEKHNGNVPDTIDELLELPGVGRKTANLVLTIAFKKQGICVDTHVHRIMNRWGYVHTKTPFETEMTLRGKLPPLYWIIINDLLVSYGQNLCKPVSPKCTLCRITRYCDYYKNTFKKS